MVDPIESWRRVLAAVANVGLNNRVKQAREGRLELYGDARPNDPTSQDLAHLLPPSYLEFVAAFGFPELWLPRELGLDVFFLTIEALCQVTGATGHPGRTYAEVRKERRSGTYIWEYAMFAGNDFADVNGWALGPNGDVWQVEQGLPQASCGTFCEWMEGLACTAEKLLGLDEKELALVHACEAPYDDFDFS